MRTLPTTAPTTPGNLSPDQHSEVSDRVGTSRGPRKARLAAVGAAVLAALAVWVIAEPVYGVAVQSPATPGQPSYAIGAPTVAGVAAIASLAGWALLAGLERVTSRARTVWTVTAIVVLVLSLGGPFSGTGITTANRVTLALLHVTVGAVLIPMLSRTSPAR